MRQRALRAPLQADSSKKYLLETTIASICRQAEEVGSGHRARIEIDPGKFAAMQVTGSPHWQGTLRQRTEPFP